MKCLPHLPTRSVGFFLLVMVASLFSLGCSESTSSSDSGVNPLSVWTTTGSTSGLPTNGTTSDVGAIDSPIVSVPSGNDGRLDHTNAPLLDNLHPGWQQATCLSCHTDQSRIPDHSYPDTSLCYLCHGTNGMPGFGDNVAPVIKNVIAAPTKTGVSVTWTTDEPAITRLILRTTAGDKMEFPVSTEYAQSHRYSVNGLLSDTQYEYEVVAIDKASNKATSASFGKLCFVTMTAGSTTTTPTTPPVTALISGPTFSDIDSFSAVAQWTTSKLTTCTIEVVDTVEGSLATHNVGGPLTTFSYKITGLLANRKYKVQINATDQAGETFSSSEKEFTTEPL